MGIRGPGNIIVGEPRPLCKWTTNTFAHLPSFNNVYFALLDSA
jgi:hypothetical protein